MSDGNIWIHKKGCSHRKPNKTNKNPPWPQEQVEKGDFDWSSKEAFCTDYWYNGIAEEWETDHPGEKYDVFQCMEFRPCCDELPDNEPEPEPEKKQKTAPKAPKEKRVTGHRQWAAKPIPSAMAYFTRWIAREFPELDIDPEDDVNQRLVTIASKAYGYFQGSDLNAERRDAA